MLAASPASSPALSGSNLVVVRVGDGGATLKSSATPVFLDDATPAGVLLQSVALPTAASDAASRLPQVSSATLGCDPFCQQILANP